MPFRHLVYLLVIFAVLSRSASAVTINWDGGGSTNLWSDADNWDTNHVPTQDDDVFFNGTSTKNCDVTTVSTVHNMTIQNAYSGTINVSVSGDFAAFHVTGNFTQMAGTINWGTSYRLFNGIFSCSGGTMDGTQAIFRVAAPGASTFSPTASTPVTIRQLFLETGTITVSSPNLTMKETFSISGGAAASLQGNGTYQFLANPANPAAFILSSGGTLEVKNGATLDATNVGSFSNLGVITKTGTGKTVRKAGAIAFTNSDGKRLESAADGDFVFATLYDDDKNLNGTIAETVSILYTCAASGDVETSVLTETTPSSGLFRSTLAVPVSTQAHTISNGVLERSSPTSILAVTYTDPSDATDVISRTLPPDGITWASSSASTWSTAGSWSPNTVPTLYDDVYFTNSFTGTCNIDGNYKVQSFQIENSIASQINFNGGPFTIEGTFEQNGGSINWGGSYRYFKGDWVQGSGTFNASQAIFSFMPSSNGSLIASNLAVRSLQVQTVAGKSYTFNSPIQASQELVASGAGVVNFLENVTLANGSTFSNGAGSDVRSTSSVTFDARNATTFTNFGSLVEFDGKILRNATALEFTNQAGTAVHAAVPGSTLYLSVRDGDENIDGTVPDTLSVTITSPTTGDSEVVTLMEDGVASARFRASLQSAPPSGSPTHNNQTLSFATGENLHLAYVDQNDSNDTLSADLLAPDIVWDGGGSDTSWSTAENWSTDTVPTSTDSVRFDGTSSKDCAIASPQDVTNITIATGYTGKITQGNSTRINGNVQQSSGTMEWNGTVFLVGSITQTGGTFDAADAMVSIIGPAQTISVSSQPLTILEVTVGPQNQDVDLTLASPTVIKKQLKIQAGIVRANGSLTLSDNDCDFLVMPNGSLLLGAGVVFDATAAASYDNRGVISRGSGSYILWPNADLKFINEFSFTVNPAIGQDVFLSIDDENANLAGGLNDTVVVRITDTATGDIENFTLTEINNFTGLFVSATPLSFTDHGVASTFDGTLRVNVGDTITAQYTDAQDANDTASISRIVLMNPVGWSLR